MATAPESTVVEFAAKHCAGHNDLTETSVKAHVNAIILAAITRNLALWTVGIDGDGRASLIWISLPDEAWTPLLNEGIQLVSVMAMLGDFR